ncbi:MAG: hypothetical protein RLZZ299_2312 [Pseudomonadota bacterium]
MIVHLLLATRLAHAQPPTGWIDVADGTRVSGWARDPDWSGPIAVHIYVDGVIARGMAAEGTRSDVGAHAYEWAHEPLGAGRHEIKVYAIGVDASGQPDGVNPLLTTRYVDVGCAGLTGDPRAWCDGNGPYWRDRARDTQYVGNAQVRAGVNTSYGGTVFQLFDEDWTRNLLMEHGGAAMQLSIWGYDPVGGTGWFSLDSCDATAYASDAACRAAGHGTCVARAFSAGAHVSNCANTAPCVTWDAGAPWNPIQAQGSGCAWDNEANDAWSADWVGDALEVVQVAPRHFTKRGAGVADLTFEQRVTPGEAWIQVDYTIRYEGTRTWSDHDQEIPALFTAQGVDAHFYWYQGDAPFADPASPVAHATSPVHGALAFPGVDPRTSRPIVGTASERWWSACDSSNDRCLTVATFDPLVLHAALVANPGTGAYLTPIGIFNLHPGFERTWSVWVFPYRWDAVVNGRSIRQMIGSIAASQGCRAEIACNGVDEDCTGADFCAGGGSGGTGGGNDTGASGGTGGGNDTGASGGTGGGNDTGASGGTGGGNDTGASGASGGPGGADGVADTAALDGEAFQPAPGTPLGCGGCATTSSASGAAWLVAGGLVAARRRSRWRREARRGRG